MKVQAVRMSQMMQMPVMMQLIVRLEMRVSAVSVLELEIMPCVTMEIFAPRITVRSWQRVARTKQCPMVLLVLKLLRVSVRRRPVNLALVKQQMFSAKLLPGRHVQIRFAMTRPASATCSQRMKVVVATTMIRARQMIHALVARVLERPTAVSVRMIMFAPRIFVRTKREVMSVVIHLSQGV